VDGSGSEGCACYTHWMVSTSLYIHIPFCIHRCGYCDFNTYAGLQYMIQDYCEAVCRELVFLSSSATGQVPVKTIYFGGGTPSLLAPQDIEKILTSIQKGFVVDGGVEISLEANPGTVNKVQLKDFHDLGIGRLSLGMQSAIPGELQLLERQHSFEDVIRAVEWARESGVDNLNLDLIFGLPYQDLASWLTSVEAALSLNPEHLSLYALTIEHGTPLQHQVEQGILPQPDQDLAADMYEAAQEKLGTAGYYQYEISNWARNDHEGLLKACQHNLQYWRNLPYIGVGAGAHGFIDHHRTVNVSTPGAYIHRLSSSNNDGGNLAFPGTPATVQKTYIDQEIEIGETMMMGLRLVDEGISRQAFFQRFAIDLKNHFKTEIEKFTSLGLLEWGGENNDRLRLTPKGYLLGNQVFVEFI
jgi:oxygen-independent coproporphyrinogen-3 oxidase